MILFLLQHDEVFEEAILSCPIFLKEIESAIA